MFLSLLGCSSCLQRGERGDRESSMDVGPTLAQDLRFAPSDL